MKVTTIIGARPQFIKAAIVSRAIREQAELHEVVVHTGQHHDQNMSSVFFEELGLPEPDRNLGIAGGSHGAMTGQMLEAIESVLMDEAPDWVLVYGDTNSTLAGALAAAKLHLPVAHVEAGLRSFNRRMPEEINRVLTDHVSTVLFAPTEIAVANLRREGVAPDSIELVGDVMYDASLHYRSRSDAESGMLDRLGLRAGGYVLATMHRAENTDESRRLRAIIFALMAVAERMPVVLPLHPRTRAAAARLDLLAPMNARLRVIEPVGYLDMVALESRASVIVTDSGGVQKEAYFQRVPCVTVRDETEWVELVEHGWNRLQSPTSPEAVAQAILLAVGSRGEDVDLYGGGNAAQRVVRRLLGASLPWP